MQILIRTDGSFIHWTSTWDSTLDSNSHWHFAAGSDECGDGARLTEGQRRTMAQIHLGIQRPLGLRGGLGAPPCRALSLGPDEMSRLYGTGAPVYVAA